MEMNMMQAVEPWNLPGVLFSAQCVAYTYVMEVYTNYYPSKRPLYVYSILTFTVFLVIATGISFYWENRRFLYASGFASVYGVYFLLYALGKLPNFKKKSNKKEEENYNTKKAFYLESVTVKKLKFYNPFRHFLVISGTGGGKTKSIGKPLLANYIRSGFAGFIYDVKDFDYTKTALIFCEKYNYPNKFYYLNFMDPERSYRTNPMDPKGVSGEREQAQYIGDKKR